MSITTTPQRARVYAIFDNPPAVFACKVNQTFPTHDKVFEFIYDSATLGSFSNILPGMTILLGSMAGAYDKGITYCRKAPTSSKIFCGETSEVAWADNLYVTVLQDWSIWNEYLRIATDGTVYMKYDVAYSNQHSKLKPVPILGPDRVVFIAYPSVSVSFDGSHSYVPGSTIASHSFSCSGGSITGASTETPTLTFTSTGRYVLTYTVTSAQGVSSTTYRTIHVVSLGTPEDYVIDTREWHASVDFSGTQGLHNWRYQYLSNSVYADLNSYASSYWKLSPEGYPVVTSTAMHPSASGQAAVRTWIAPDSMIVRLTASVTKAGNGGDGVIANLKHNSDLLWTHTFGAASGETSSYDMTIEVTAGDRIYHVIDPLGSYNSDSTTWDPDIVASRLLAPAVDPFGISEVVSGSLSGDFETGGWSFETVVLSNATFIRERTKVILFSEEWYGATKISYGLIAGAENIIAIGWISDEKITLNVDQGQVAVNVQGTQYWLQKIYSFVPHGIERTGGTPAAWTQMNPVTVDKVLWNLFMWRSTACNCVDVFLTGDTRQATELTATSNSIWEQVKEIAYGSILATPCCDRYGRIRVQVEAALLPNAGRSAVPTNAELTSADCESIDIERVSVAPASQVVLSGISVSGSAGAAKFSLSRGHIPAHYGTPIKMERLLLSTQALANELAGNVLEKANAPYRFTFNNLLYNNRRVDICPRQFIDVTINAFDNPRGIAYSGNAIVKHIDLNFNDGAWDISWEAEPETKSVLTVDGDIPTDPDEDPWKPPIWPPVVPPKIPDFVVPLDPPVITLFGIVAILIGGYGVWAMDTLNAPGEWYNVTTPFDWSLEELALIGDFVLSPIGIAYIAGAQYIWSQPVSSVSGRTELGGPDLFGTGMVNGIGFRSDAAYGFALSVNYSGSPLGGNAVALYNLSGAGELVKTFSGPVPYPGGYGGINGNFTYYLGSWYMTGSYGGTDSLIRYTGDLTGFEGTPNTLSLHYPQTGIFHVQAKDADIIYAVYGSTTARLKPSDLTLSADITDGKTSSAARRIACDETGQYVFVSYGSMAYSTGIRKSSSFGETWEDVNNFPSLSFDGSIAGQKNAVVYNLGGQSFLVCFNRTVFMEPDHIDDRVDRLQIWYTPDFGATWQDWALNLAANGVIPENATVWSIQNA